jgi:hypothetical protein
VQNSSIALKKVLAQRGLGKPKIPLEIAGIAMVSQSKLFARTSVLKTAA